MLNSFSETNFNNAWYKAIQHVLKQKQPLIFGKEKKKALDSTQCVELTGRAISQILNGEIHPQSTFKALDSYKREFTDEYLNDYITKPDEEKFDYLYMERLARHNVFIEDECDGYCMYRHVWYDQIEELMNSIANQKATETPSNYALATTWEVGFDGGETIGFNGGETKSSPCLQIIQVRWNPGNLINLHLIWRSRDLYNAWQANIVAITDMINRECILPNNCELYRITDYSTSLHIYEGDVEAARRVGLTWPIT